MSVFADEEQAIGQSRSTLEQIKHAAGLSRPHGVLTENHRNTPEIARLAEHFHRGRLPAATVVRSGSGELPLLVRSPDTESTVNRIANEFRNRAVSVGVVVHRNATGGAVREKLRGLLPQARVDMYSNHRKNEHSIDVRTPGITVLNKESVKGQEFDTVFILELDRFVPCTSDADCRAMYMMCYPRSRQAVSLPWARTFVRRGPFMAPGDGHPGAAMTAGMDSLLEPDWLGLVIDNRRLFDALQDGWIRPAPRQIGLPVGVRAFVQQTEQQSGNRIPVQGPPRHGQAPRDRSPCVSAQRVAGVASFAGAGHRSDDLLAGRPTRFRDPRSHRGVRGKPRTFAEHGSSRIESLRS